MNPVKLQRLFSCTILISLAFGIPSIARSDMEQERLAQLYTKMAALFTNGQNITPTPGEVYPHPIHIQQSKCVNLHHHHEVFPMGVSKIDEYSERNEGPSEIVQIENDPIAGYVIHLPNCWFGSLIGVFQDGQYYWSKLEQLQFGERQNQYSLRRVRFQGPTSVDEMWVSQASSRLMYKDLWDNRYCYYY
jgi:hypothetical protein